MKKIGIVGYGYVGKGMERLFKDHFELVIYDIDRGTKQEINKCDLVIICVPTKMNDNGTCDTSIVRECVMWITSPLVMIKSTIPPGTTDNLPSRGGQSICFSPEYMGESKNFTPFWKYADPREAKMHDFVIVGGDKANEILNYFMKVMAVEAHYISCTAREAELVKYMENSYFATKVAFCNEFYDIAKAFNVDFKKVREMWLLDSRIDRNHTLVFEDERGFSGKCLPKDVSAIVKASEAKGYSPTILKAVLKANGN